MRPAVALEGSLEKSGLLPVGEKGIILQVMITTLDKRSGLLKSNLARRVGFRLFSPGKNQLSRV
jgi:hypothetical protein